MRKLLIIGFLALALAGCRDYVYHGSCTETGAEKALSWHIFAPTPEDKIASMTADGWELVSVDSTSDCPHYLTFRKARSKFTQ